MAFVNVIAVTGHLSLIDDVTDAIDVQVAKNKRDLEQEIVILFSAPRNQCAMTT